MWKSTRTKILTQGPTNITLSAITNQIYIYLVDYLQYHKHSGYHLDTIILIKSFLMLTLNNFSKSISNRIFKACQDVTNFILQ